jgi:hypothetical protein
VRRLARTAGIGAWEQLSPHSLRHSAITFALDAGAPLRDVQDYAGYKDPLLATSLYGDPSAGMLEDASARLGEHPAPVGCSILGRPSPPYSVSGHPGSAAGHEEGTVLITLDFRSFTLSRSALG